MSISDIKAKELKQIQEFDKNIISKLDASTFNLGMEIVEKVIRQLNPKMMVAFDDTETYLPIKFEDILFMGREENRL